MTRLGRMVALAVAATLAAAAIAIADPAGTPFPVALAKGSTLSLAGTSNVHDFESVTKDVTLAFTRKADAVAPTDPASFRALVDAGGVQGMTLKVAVRTLKSSKEGLDKNLYKALKADAFPTIEFALTSYTSAPVKGDTTRIEAKGTLTIAGKTRPVALAARLVPTGNMLALDGSTQLLMTDYGVKPPTMMLGALKVADKITVQYRLQLIPGAEAAAPAAKN